MMLKPRHALTFLFTALSLPTFLSAAAYSDPLGIIRVDLKGNDTLNVLSNPFLPHALLRSQVTAVSGTSVTIAATPSVSLGGTHYLEVTSGTAAGLMTDIVSSAGPILELAEDLSDLSVDDTIAIREIPTLQSVLGTENKFGFAERTTLEDLRDYDEIYVINPSNQIVVVAQYANVDQFVGWVNANGNAVNPKIYPESGILAKIRGDDVSVTFVGEVVQATPNVAVFPGINFVTVFNPLSGVEGIDPNRVLTLDTAGLYTGDPTTGVIPWDGVVRNDEVLLPSLNTPGSFETFFYYDGPLGDGPGWYNLGFKKVENRVIESGTSIVVTRYKNDAPPFGWPQPNLHLAAP